MKSQEKRIKKKNTSVYVRTIKYPWEKEKRKIKYRILSVLLTEIFSNFFYLLSSFK